MCYSSKCGKGKPTNKYSPLTRESGGLSMVPGTTQCPNRLKYSQLAVRQSVGIMPRSTADVIVEPFMNQM